MGFTLAMLVIVTSIQPAQARLAAYGQFYGISGISNLPAADPSQSIDAALYIAEESEDLSGYKSRSQRLGSSDPLSLVADVSPTVVCWLCRGVPPDQAPPVTVGAFLSPLKTGPPSV